LSPNPAVCRSPKGWLCQPIMRPRVERPRRGRSGGVIVMQLMHCFLAEQLPPRGCTEGRGAARGTRTAGSAGGCRPGRVRMRLLMCSDAGGADRRRAGGDDAEHDTEQVVGCQVHGSAGFRHGSAGFLGGRTCGSPFTDSRRFMSLLLGLHACLAGLAGLPPVSARVTSSLRPSNHVLHLGPLVCTIEPTC
jgi:hypothetical protein